MSLVKYRLKEVAADFGVAPKVIADIISKYFQKPKSNTQVLTDEELNLVFDSMTQTHQIASLEQVFAVKPAPKAEPPKPEAPKAEAPKQEAQQAAKPQQAKPQSQPQNQNRPQQPAAPSAQPAKADKPKEPERKRERRVVDTSAVQVNAGRFADVDNLVSEKVQNYQGGKQRIGGKKGQQGNKQQNGKFRGSKSRNEEQEKMRRLQMEVARKAPLTVKIPEEITVGELASRMKKTAGEVIKCLMKNGVMAAINQTIDFDTAEFVATEMGCKVEKEVTVTIEEQIIDDHVDTAEELETRAPVVVVMGHVDHGKTSLLDAIRKTSVTAGEAGGITQHIGAYTRGREREYRHVPGYPRPRGLYLHACPRRAGPRISPFWWLPPTTASCPRPSESINHAKAADVPIIVAINKMDKPTANPDNDQGAADQVRPGSRGVGRRDRHLRARLRARPVRAWTICWRMVILAAEVQGAEGQPQPPRQGRGHRGAAGQGPEVPLPPCWCRTARCRPGDIVIAGTAVGRVRSMTDHTGRPHREGRRALPCRWRSPVLPTCPRAGDEFDAVADERMAA